MKNILSKLYLILVFVILYIPIIYLAYFSFSSGKTMVVFEDFSFIHYKELIENTRMIVILINTIVIALLCGIFSAVLGTLGALGIFSLKTNKFKNSYLVGNNILIVSPDVIIGCSFLLVFTFISDKLGLESLQGFWSVLISHIAFSVPIVVLMVLPKLYEMPISMIDAAVDLGATYPQVITKVIIPYITPGILAGFFMGLTYSLDDFAVTFFVTGNGFQTLSVEIYSMARQGINLQINALSTVITLFVIIAVLIYYVISMSKLKKEVTR
ncbi:MULTISPECIES: ABC transporter permease [unclassified Gemella]|uniref:ABC transporter permease n=1 Tax=unclassified Gemella TaxID=2624949 RepID=UPI001C03C179|nr:MULTISPECIES: ABC transporter permease [unclassified Gemella]MBU0278820.1 ABC transporter permease [Gemella sp. zg-1178]QWQ39370.1 ABC transporter permease [Gemella sp. zg-570]